MTKAHMNAEAHKHKRASSFLPDLRSFELLGFSRFVVCLDSI